MICITRDTLLLSFSLFVHPCCLLVYLYILLLYFSVCSDGQVRLMNGSATEGRVEVCKNDRYHTVCDDYWDDFEASIVCKQVTNNTSNGACKTHLLI